MTHRLSDSVLTLHRIVKFDNELALVLQFKFNPFTLSVTGDERVLNEVDVPVLTYETCVDWYEAENILIDTEQHVCAGYEKGGLDACQGDSGGPFGKIWLHIYHVTHFQHFCSVCRRDTRPIGGQHSALKVLTGIVSFGVGCAQEKNPGVYSNVNYFLPYIFKIIHGKNIFKI